MLSTNDYAPRETHPLALRQRFSPEAREAIVDQERMLPWDAVSENMHEREPHQTTALVAARVRV